MLAKTIILEYVCPILGIIIAQIMFAAPLQSVRECVKKGSLGVLNPAPWAIMTGNCAGWVGYSYVTKNIFVLAGNVGGLLLSIWLNFCAIKLQYHDYKASIMRKSMASFLTQTRESMRTSIMQFRAVDLESIDTAIPAADSQEPSLLLDSRFGDIGNLVLGLTATENSRAPAPQENILIIVTGFWLFIFSLVSFVHLSNTKKVLIVGVLANMNNLFFYAAPLTTIFSVFRTRNSISIHRRTLIMNTTNGAFWTAYGLAVSDIFLVIPNSIGTILGVFQMILCIIFPAKLEDNEGLVSKSVVVSSTEEGNASSNLGTVVASSTEETNANPNHDPKDCAQSTGASIDPLINRKSTVRFSSS